MINRKRPVAARFNALVATSQAFVAVVAGVTFALALWS
jgi:hypothetical protein